MVEPGENLTTPSQNSKEQYTRNHMGTVYSLLLRSRPDIMALDPAVKNHFKEALAATFLTQPSVTATEEEKKRIDEKNFLTALTMTQEFQYPGRNEDIRSVFPLHEYKKQYTQAIENILQACRTPEGKFDREQLVAWASIEALKLSDPKVKNAQREGFNNLIYLMSRAGFFGLQRGNAIYFKLDLLARLWDNGVSRDIAIPIDHHEQMKPPRDQIIDYSSKNYGVAEGSYYRYELNPKAPPASLATSHASIEAFVQPLILHYKPPQTLN